MLPRDRMKALLSEGGSRSVREGQTASSSTPASACERPRKPTNIIWDRYVCFQASDKKEKNPIARRQTSPAGCPKPRASHRFSNFRNQAGICLTKINLVPNIYFCHYFRVVWRGRSTQARHILLAAHRGHFLGCPLGLPPHQSWQPESKSGGQSCWHHIRSLKDLPLWDLTVLSPL